MVKSEILAWSGVCAFLIVGTGIYFVMNQGESITIPPTTEFTNAISFLTPSGSSGTYYFGGFYDFASSDNDFSPVAINWGTTNSSYSAHFFVVTGAVPVDEVTISVTGIGVFDNGTAIPSYTDNIVIPTGTPVNSYFEIDKFIGEVSVETTGGTPITTNYGWSKYWDNQNRDFQVQGIEALWLGSANDPNYDMKLLHHKQTGWTFNAGAEPTPPASIIEMRVDQINSGGARNGENGAWKHVGLTQLINGSQSDGIMVEVVTTANAAIDVGSISVFVRDI